MPKVLFFADPSNGRPGLGATIRLDSGEPCLISIAQTGVRVRKTRFGFLGPVLYSEKNVYQAAATAKALSERFPNNLLPTEFSNPVLRAFANAVLHCSTCAEVAVTLNEALGTIQSVGVAPPTETGTTPERAIRIHATNSLENLVLSRDKSLTVLLPQNEFFTLFTGLLKLTEAQLSQIGLTQTDRKKMLDPFADAMKAFHGKYENVPEHVSVTTLMSGWSKILGLLAFWQPRNLLQEEELENLKAIIGGTMKDARR